MALRLFVLQAHYRKPIDFSDETVATAKNSWQTLKEGLLFGFEFGAALGWVDTQAADFGDPSAMRIDTTGDVVERFRIAMDDDFNTASAIAPLFELAKELRRQGNVLSHTGEAEGNSEDLRQQWQMLVCLAQVLGLEARPELQTPAMGPSDAEIEALIQQRQAARQAKDFAEGDRIRDLLNAQGISLIDQAGNTTRWWREN
jgi:cysteinyl-tRNA synthetase